MFKINQLRNLIGLLLIAGLSACAYNPKTDFDPNTDFSQYRSFQWQYSEDSTGRSVADPVYDSPLFEKKLETAIGQRMLDKGYNGSANPDMYLTYHMADAKRKNYPLDIAVGYGHYGRHSYWNIYAPSLRHLERDEVLVIVDAMDANNNELIWRGWTKTRRRSTPHNQSEMAVLADRILAGFPSD